MIYGLAENIPRIVIVNHKTEKICTSIIRAKNSLIHKMKAPTH